MFGSFQRAQFYRQAEPRWRDFVSTSDGVWALADFGEHALDGSPVEVAVPTGAALNREWTLVCLADDLPACVSAWELPGQAGVPDAERCFETVWSLDPAVVRDAAGTCARTIQDLGVPTDLSHVLDGPGYHGSQELDRATAVFNRIVAYVDRSSL
jgi:DICT domain-containing protein